MGTEQRQYPRIPIHAFIQFYEESDFQRTPRRGVIKNFSEGGLCVSTDRPLFPGSIVTVEIPIETAQGEIRIVQVRGIVRWLKETGRAIMGIEFFALSSDEQADFEQWMANFVD